MVFATIVACSSLSGRVRSVGCGSCGCDSSVDGEVDVGCSISRWGASISREINFKL